MQPFDPVVQDQVREFGRRIAQSERFYRQAIGSVAAHQMVYRARRAPRRPRSCWLLWMPGCLLIRAGHWLLSRATRKEVVGLRRGGRHSGREPIIIDIDAHDIDAIP